MSTPKAAARRETPCSMPQEIIGPNLHLNTGSLENALRTLTAAVSSEKAAAELVHLLDVGTQLWKVSCLSGDCQSSDGADIFLTPRM